ncbi:MAG: MgtC/SapB family protein [Desulfohalobiaceae bacterium]|nr:MgtC/SapB family protein [Desulfohalobiaceae bacterium]
MQEILFEFLARQEWTELFKLILAALLGGIIGLEREAHGQAAGLRTNILLAIAACLLMQLSLYIPQMHLGHGEESIIRADPGRIASYTVAGMGFLGAGTIIKGRGSIRGLTTAAGLWLVTALGLAIGAGLYLPALVTSGITFLALFGLRVYRPDIARDQHTLLTVRCCCEARPINEIRRVLDSFSGLSIEFVNYKENMEEQDVTYTFRMVSKDDLAWNELLDSLREIHSILEFSWREAEVP